MKEFILNLQLFAEAGTVVNTLTQGYMNAYTGDKEATTALNPELKTFYDTELLENARIEMYYAQFAKKQTLPKKHGGTIEWRKFNTFKKADQLIEGKIPEGQKGGVSRKLGFIAQYGTYTAVSDILEMRAYDDIILGFTEEMGASAAETQETLIRDALLTNITEMFCDNITLATGAVSGTAPTEHNLMEATATVMSVLTPKMVAKAVTRLKKSRVPTINGKYYAVIHPSVAHDLRNSDEWIEAHKYSATSEIFNGEIGELHGCRFIENPFAPVCGGKYVNKAGGKTYATHFFGKDAFGIVDPEGGSLEMIVKSKEQVGGPIEQFSTVGYKFETNGATILYPERLLCVWSCSSYSAIDEANYDETYYTPENYYAQGE